MTTTRSPPSSQIGAGGAVAECAAEARPGILLDRDGTIIVDHGYVGSVDRVDFITSIGFGDGPGVRERLGLRGAGPQRVITDLGVLQPDPAREHAPDGAQRRDPRRSGAPGTVRRG